MCDRLVEAMAGGLTVEAAAAKIGISARSLFYWQQQHPEFLQAIQEGRQRSQLWWEERALAMANGESGNTQIVVLGLRNRSRAATGWNNDTVKLEHTGPEGGPVEVKAEHKIDIASLEPEQRDQLREILLNLKALATKAV
jgi:transposase-like protein